MNYDEIVVAIKGYAENTFPTTVGFESIDQINGFIRAAEQRIHTTVQLPALKSNMWNTVEAKNPYISLPKDFLALESAAIRVDGKYYPMVDKSESFIREAYPDRNMLGRPRYVAIFGAATDGSKDPKRVTTTSLIMAPTPDNYYEIEVHYLYIPGSITDHKNHPKHTWLGSNFPTLLIYGALLEAATFMQLDADVVSLYKGRYDEAIAIMQTTTTGRALIGNYRRT